MPDKDPMLPAAPAGEEAPAAPPTAAEMAAWRERTEHEVIVHLAGYAGTRRALRGSSPGFQMWRSPEELCAMHECGHAIAMWEFGMPVRWLSIVPDESVHIASSAIAFSGGFAQGGGDPLPPSTPPARAPRTETDYRKALTACYALSLSGSDYGRRAAVRIAKRLREQARELVDLHWYKIVGLSGELMRSRSMDQAAIERILPPRL